MSSYVKISYKTKTTNLALKKCIEYIGKHYGNNNKYDTIYKSGKAFLAKKVKGSSKTAIKHMIYSKKIKNSEMRQWKFKKKSYEKTYRYIVSMLLQKNEYRNEALDLLNLLYLELLTLNDNSKVIKTLSNILVSEQKDLLFFALDKSQYVAYQKVIRGILQGYNDCDTIYKNYITKRN